MSNYRERQNIDAIIRWLNWHPEGWTYGAMDPTINLESLPKPTNDRVLMNMYRVNTVLETEKSDAYWVSDQILNRAYYQLEKKRWDLFMRVKDVFTGDGATIRNLDMWQTSEKLGERLKGAMVADAIQFILQVVGERWLDVPHYDQAPEKTPRQRSTKRRQDARVLWADYYRQAIEQVTQEHAHWSRGAQEKKAVGMANRFTSAATGYNRVEIWRILQEYESLPEGQPQGQPDGEEVAS